MTKAEIVNEVAKATGLEKIAVQNVVESFMESVKGSIKRNDPVYLRGFGSFIINNVYLRGFGSFVVKQRAQKTARNISKNQTITIAAHKIPAFKPAKVFVDQVKKLK